MHSTITYGKTSYHNGDKQNIHACIIMYVYQLEFMS